MESRVDEIAEFASMNDYVKSIETSKMEKVIV